jgi:hypothetical protein
LARAGCANRLPFPLTCRPAGGHNKKWRKTMFESSKLRKVIFGVVVMIVMFMVGFVFTEADLLGALPGVLLALPMPIYVVGVGSILFVIRHQNGRIDAVEAAPAFWGGILVLVINFLVALAVAIL